MSTPKVLLDMDDKTVLPHCKYVLIQKGAGDPKYMTLSGWHAGFSLATAFSGLSIRKSPAVLDTHVAMLVRGHFAGTQSDSLPETVTSAK